MKILELSTRLIKPVTQQSANRETANDAAIQVTKYYKLLRNPVHHQCLATWEWRKTLGRLSSSVSFKPRNILPASEPAVLRRRFSSIRFTYLAQEQIELEVKGWSEKTILQLKSKTHYTPLWNARENINKGTSKFKVVNVWLLYFVTAQFVVFNPC